jgi:transcriptional regulator with XRE-family HTH domain
LPRRVHRDRGEGPHATDILVGARIRLRRTMLRLSQESLADAVGLTFQQVQKYERGINRVGASRLWELARVLDVPIAFFFDNEDPVHASATGGFGGADEAMADDPMHRRETAELLDTYYAIGDLGLRRRFLDLVKALATASNDGERSDNKAIPQGQNKPSKRVVGTGRDQP